MDYIPKFFRQTLSANESLFPALANSGWLIFDKLVRIFFSLFISALIARYLGPLQYGELAYVIAYLAFFQVLSTLGMDGVIVREIAKDKQHAGGLLGSAFFMRVIAGIFCWISSILIMVVIFGWSHPRVYITALAGASLFFQAADTVDLWFQSQSQSKRTVISKLIAYFISNAIKVILVFAKAPLILFSLVIALDVLIAAVALFYAYKKYPCSQPWVLIRSKALTILIESWPYLLSGLAIVIYMRIDQFMIGMFLGEKELGIYAAVLPLATMWSFIPMTLSISLAPYVARKKCEDQLEYMSVLTSIFRGFSLLSWCIIIPVFLLSGPVVEFLFGHEYTNGAHILSVVVFTNLFINMGVAQNLWLLNEGKSLIGLYKTIIGVLVCVIANIILIPKLGMTGAAISSILAQFFSAFLSNIFFCRNIFYIQLKSVFLLK
ncbi:flippase [Aeromonas allosaccharophila]|uniref:flippase n=1 Tax=Aeromonas allosaccharophila TaxID=656 RepID=UPI002B48DD91|nr:flippase [Aeromonas allosaccharophila]